MFSLRFGTLSTSTISKRVGFILIYQYCQKYGNRLLKIKRFSKRVKNQSIPDFVYNSTALSTSNNTSDFIGFNNVLESLETDKQELINMAYYQGYTQNEISEQLKIPLGTVKTKMRNALMKLRDLLKDYQ